MNSQRLLQSEIPSQASNHFIILRTVSLLAYCACAIDFPAYRRDYNSTAVILKKVFNVYILSFKGKIMPEETALGLENLQEIKTEEREREREREGIRERGIPACFS